MKTLQSIYSEVYKIMDPNVGQVYYEALSRGLELKSERKSGYLSIYAWYSESAWVEIFETRLEENEKRNRTDI